jgi:hypothetical protein
MRKKIFFPFEPRYYLPSTFVPNIPIVYRVIPTKIDLGFAPFYSLRKLDLECFNLHLIGDLKLQERSHPMYLISRIQTLTSEKYEC